MIDLDELERLEREATEAREAQPYIKGWLEAEGKLVDALYYAARDLIADARRYRWLLNEIDRVDVPPLGRVVWKQRDDRESHLWCDFATSQEVSAAIDAAIARERKE